MKICPKCARAYEDNAVHCRKCKLELVSTPAAYREQDDPKKRRIDWIYLLVGTPLFILLLRFIYQFIVNKQ